MSEAEQVLGWGIDDLALYVPPERGGGGMRRVRVASDAFWEDGDARPWRTVAFLDERGKRYDVHEHDLARCDAEFRILGDVSEHLRVQGRAEGEKHDRYFEAPRPDLVMVDQPSGAMAEPSDHHLLLLEQAEAARTAARAARRRRDTQAAREESAKAAGLEMKVELELIDKAAQADAERHRTEAETLAKIRHRAALREIAGRRKRARAAARAAGVPFDKTAFETPASPIVVGSEAEDAYLSFATGRGYQVRTRRVRRLRVLTPDGLVAMYESGRLTAEDLEACRRYRDLFNATERGVRSSMNMDRTGGMNSGAEERRNAQWADRLEIERRAREHPARNGFEIMALEEICGRGRCVNDLVSGGHKRSKLSAALERVTDIILAWLKEPKDRL